MRARHGGQPGTTRPERSRLKGSGVFTQGDHARPARGSADGNSRKPAWTSANVWRRYVDANESTRRGNAPLGIKATIVDPSISPGPARASPGVVHHCDERSVSTGRRSAVYDRGAPSVSSIRSVDVQPLPSHCESRLASRARRRQAKDLTGSDGCPATVSRGVQRTLHRSPAVQWRPGMRSAAAQRPPGRALSITAGAGHPRRIAPSSPAPRRAPRERNRTRCATRQQCGKPR